MNAESLDFESNSFDFVWSWGVIHHSANTSKILQEIHRVLKPGGKFVCMVYHRGYWNYYLTGIAIGSAKMRFFRGDSLHKVVQDHCDGAMARFYTPVEWEIQLEDAGFRVKKISVMGMKTELFLIPASWLKNFLLFLIPNGLARFLTNNLRMGSLLVSEAGKPA
jgi:SAM-dependent methyltransferase